MRLRLAVATILVAGGLMVAEVTSANGAEAPHAVGFFSDPALPLHDQAGWTLWSDGTLTPINSALLSKGLPDVGVHVNDIVSMLSTPDGKGYLLLGADGGVFAFGDAHFRGSLPGLGIHEMAMSLVWCGNTQGGYGVYPASSLFPIQFFDCPPG